MHDSSLNAPGLGLQDRDLLQRLNLYFESLESRLESGEGWLIFNATGGRSARITQYIQRRLRDAYTGTYFVVPWRDFSLTSYMVEVELQSVQSDPVDLPVAQKREYDIATKVSQQTMVRMVTADLLVVPGLSPKHVHEVRYLAATVEARHRSRLATIILTPDAPHHLEQEVIRLAEHGRETWNQMSRQLYETSLIAL
jgi:hypothetical protein